jgi:SAM-dependent methyltransferase
VIFVGAPRGEIGSFCELARGERRFGNGGHRREPTLSDPIEANRRQWAERLPVHLASGFYDVAAFKAGRSSVRSIELEEVGSVTDRDLLHLQCHFGLDTISWARLGARVTGVDFESGAIETARRLANELGVAARFVCSTIDDLPNALDAEFDVIFASYGVLMWLPDLERWAELVAQFLRPKGVFHLVEFHPVVGGLGDSQPALKPYYFLDGPLRWEHDTDYADPSHVLEHPSYEWVHRIGDVVNALVGAGLVFESLREHPVAPEQFRPYMVNDPEDHRWWRIPGDPIPLTYSLRARKPNRPRA